MVSFRHAQAYDNNSYDWGRFRHRMFARASIFARAWRFWLPSLFLLCFWLCVLLRFLICLLLCFLLCFFSLLGLRAGGELWIYEEGGDSKRRAPCSRGRDGTYLLGLRAGGELWIYEEGGDNKMPTRDASGATRRSLGIIASPDLGARKPRSSPPPFPPRARWRWPDHLGCPPLARSSRRSWPARAPSNKAGTCKRETLAFV